MESLSRPSGNTVGGTSSQAQNVIVANQRDGVTLASSANLVAGNLIGTDSGSDDNGNIADGILVEGAANTVGGTAAGAGNVVSANDTGIAIEGLQAAANLVAGNLVGTTSDGSAPLGNLTDGIADRRRPEQHGRRHGSGRGKRHRGQHRQRRVALRLDSHGEPDRRRRHRHERTGIESGRQHARRHPDRPGRLE